MARPVLTTKGKDGEQEQMVLVLRRRSKRDPREWLSDYQKRMAEAAPKAAEATKHLSGLARMDAYRRLLRELLSRPPGG